MYDTSSGQIRYLFHVGWHPVACCMHQALLNRTAAVPVWGLFSFSVSDISVRLYRTEFWASKGLPRTESCHSLF